MDLLIRGMRECPKVTVAALVRKRFGMHMYALMPLYVNLVYDTL